MQRPRDLEQSGNLPVPGSTALPPADQAMSPAHREAARRHLDRLAKPPGSLGRLEDLAARLCTIQGTLSPRTRPRRVVIFVADHGVVDEGVSAWPPSVTAVMIQSIVRGGAACTALAASCESELILVDVGSRSEPLPPSPGYHVRKVGRGTANLAVGPAMSSSEFEQAFAVGLEQARRAHDDGMKLVAAGEMGIGNTTSASCLAVLLAGVSLERAVGRGAGAGDATLERKRRVVEQAAARAAQASPKTRADRSPRSAASRSWRWPVSSSKLVGSASRSCSTE